jgi:hypothetical protein
MTLAADIARCIGIGTAEGAPDSECLDCERRTAGIAEYVHGGHSILWMPVPQKRPCPEKLVPLERKRA